MTRKTDIVVTTIFEPLWLSGYLRNLRDSGSDEEVTIRIIADRKTPASVFEAADAARRDGFQVDCPDLEEQGRYLERIDIPRDFIPWNTDNRRNIGFLRAWESGAEVLISIDDDNYCLPGRDFVGAHHVVGSKAGSVQNTDYVSSARWYNICERLVAQVGDAFFARGYPYYARKSLDRVEVTEVPDSAQDSIVAVNAGLWLDDPDVDAMSRLVQGPTVTAAADRSVMLAPETWSPINTQNTALLREAIPAYYYIRMGFPIKGMSIDRFGDILSGYFLQKCAKHLGHVIRFGDPIAEHHRTPHNLFKDLFHELAGMVVIEDLLPWLQELQLEGSTYLEAYASLAEALRQESERFKGFVWDDGGRQFLRETAECMKLWLAAVMRLDNKV